MRTQSKRIFPIVADSWKYRRTGVVSMLALSCFLLSGATAPVTCADPQPKSDAGEVVAVAVVSVAVAGTVVLIAVHNAHHTIKGCVLKGAGGLRVQDKDLNLYDLSGATADLKVGDQVKVHGDKFKKAKGATSQLFVVQKMSKDYGPCQLGVTAAASAAQAPGAAAK